MKSSGSLAITGQCRELPERFRNHGAYLAAGNPAGIPVDVLADTSFISSSPRRMTPQVRGEASSVESAIATTARLIQ
jgi:hypothetical protein